MIKEKEKKESLTFLSVDFGETNIGLAFGRNHFVMPLKTIAAKNSVQAINEISSFVIQNKVDKIIMGLPLNYEGKETPMARKVRAFAKIIKVRVKRPVEFIDEYGSSQESLETSIDLGIAQKKRRKIDHLSAAVILKNYFDKKS